MSLRKSIGFILMAVLLSACAGVGTYNSDPRPDVTRDYALRDLRFVAPEELEISEAGGYYPTADVVWRGDPIGDRIAQIADLFATAANRSKPAFRGAQPVLVDIQLIRFHGVTEKTRYSVGGVYNIVFSMAIRDARSGAIIEPPRRVVANLDAPGGSTAVRLEQSGQTEKVRVTNFLTTVLRNELI